MRLSLQGHAVQLVQTLCEVVFVVQMVPTVCEVVFVVQLVHTVCEVVFAGADGTVVE